MTLPGILRGHRFHEPHASREIQTAGGQVEAIERALEAEVGCADVLQVIASVRGAVNGLMAEVAEDHIRCHVAAPTLAAKRRDEGWMILLKLYTPTRLIYICGVSAPVIWVRLFRLKPDSHGAGRSNQSLLRRFRVLSHVTVQVQHQ
jgi:DNA-binding FrmR family transcriptional regulator